MDPKSFLLSKTFWLNLITLAVLAINWVTGSGLVAPQVAEILATVVAGLNILLRFITDQPISISGK